MWTGLPEVCGNYDRITLWIDPDPNAQLILVQLLNWLGSIPEILPRLWLKQSESPIGARRSGDWTMPPRAIDPEDIILARRVWAAFRSSTPEARAALRHDPEAIRLPGLQSAVRQILNELPDATGLGATERRLLRLVEREGHWDEADRRGQDTSGYSLPERERGPHRVISRALEWGERLPLWYFEAGQKLCNLAVAPAPALAGVTEPTFSMALNMDEERHRRFRESPVALTDLGGRLRRSRRLGDP